MEFFFGGILSGGVGGEAGLSGVAARLIGVVVGAKRGIWMGGLRLGVGWINEGFCS